MVIKIAHLSDTHLGYEAYRAQSPNGNNQRGEDIVRAFKQATDDILSWDPDIVIHSGDVIDRPKTDLRYMMAAKNYFQRLASIRPDGTRRQVVVVAGNHELPQSRKEACWLDLIAGAPGFHVATSGYRQVGFVNEDVDSAVKDVIVHCVPHDSLRHVDQAGVQPVEGAVNVFSSHGVATGSDLFIRAQGREYPIEESLLLRDWDYVALGHWHRQGPVKLGPLGVRKNIWYAGSTENMGFGDLKENGIARGWLRVKIGEDRELDVEESYVPIRKMVRLPEVDASGMTSKQVTDALIENLKAESVAGVVVGQIVENVPRDLWSLVDITKVRKEADRAIHYEPTVRHVRPKLVDADVVSGKTSDAQLEASLLEKIAELVPTVFAEPVHRLATDILLEKGAVLAAEGSELEGLSDVEVVEIEEGFVEPERKSA